MWVQCNFMANQLIWFNINRMRIENRYLDLEYVCAVIHGRFKTIFQRIFGSFVQGTLVKGAWWQRSPYFSWLSLSCINTLIHSSVWLIRLFTVQRTYEFPIQFTYTQTIVFTAKQCKRRIVAFSECEMNETEEKNNQKKYRILKRKPCKACKATTSIHNPETPAVV